MPHLHSALIVDTDPKGLEVLVYGFQNSGWSIVVCPLFETAPLLAKPSGAQILIISSRQDHHRALDLLRTLRSSEIANTLSFLLLAPEEVRNEIRSMDDVDLLPMPTFVTDVLCASTIIVTTRAHWAHRTPGEDPQIEIPIHPRAPLSFIRTLCGLGRSGIATLFRGEKQGEIVFHEGEVTAAQLGSFQGEDAIHRMLLWEKGTIRLQLRSVARRGQLRQTPEQFLGDAERFLRDFFHASKALGPRGSILKQAEAVREEENPNIPPEILPLIRLCNGIRTVSDLFDESPFRVLDTLRILGRMMDLGVLTHLATEAGITPNPVPTQDDFWQTACVSGSSLTAVAADSNAPVPTTPPPAPLPEVNQLSTIRPRRKDRRRLNVITPSFGVPITPGATTGSAPLAAIPPDEPQAPLPLSFPASSMESGQHTSGTIESFVTDRRSRIQYPASRERPSIVVSLFDEKSATSEPFSSPLPPSKVEPLPTVPVETRDASSSGAFPSATHSEDSTTRLAGARAVEELAPKIPRAAAAPSTRLDTSMLAEVKAESPATPDSPLVSVAPEPDAKPNTSLPARDANANGVIVSSLPERPTPSKPPQERSKGGRVSFEVDPSLAREIAEKPPEMPAASDKSKEVKPSKPQGELHVHSRKPSSSDRAAGDRPKHRPSSAFDAVESDFFAREADLYKEEKADSFADLEDPKSKHKASSRRKR